MCVSNHTATADEYEADVRGALEYVRKYIREWLDRECRQDAEARHSERFGQRDWEYPSVAGLQREYRDYVMVQSLMRTLGAVDGWPAILVRLTEEDDNRSLTLMLSRKILPLGPELNNLECTVCLQSPSQLSCSQ